MMLAKLAGIEWLKARHRTAFWAGVLGFLLILLIALGGEYYFRAYRGTELMRGPGWGNVLGFTHQVGMMLLLITVVLLSASERTWRTERQNVIDGLSRTQYFFGKLFMAIGCALILWVLALAIGAVFEVLNRQLLPDAPAFPFMRRVDVVFALGILLFLLYIAATGLLFGTVTNSSGSGLALVLLFMLIQPIVSLLMIRQGGAWADIAAYLPSQVSDSLGNIRLYGVTFAPLPEGTPRPLPVGQAAMVATLYALLFSAGAWLSIRRRDL